MSGFRFVTVFVSVTVVTYATTDWNKERIHAIDSCQEAATTAAVTRQLISIDKNGRSGDTGDDMLRPNYANVRFRELESLRLAEDLRGRSVASMLFFDMTAADEQCIQLRDDAARDQQAEIRRIETQSADSK